MKDSKEEKGKTVEQELLLRVKKDLELLYKDFIRCIFHDGSEDKIELQKQAGMVDIKLNSIIEKLSDYCEDTLGTSKQSFLVAKLKKDPPKIATAIMPLPPEQSFAKRIAAQAQEKSSTAGTLAVKMHTPAKGAFSDNVKRSPTHKFIPANGPVRILSAVVKPSK